MEIGKIKDAAYDRSVRRPLKAVRDAANALSRDHEQLNMEGQNLTMARGVSRGMDDLTIARAISLAMGRLAAAGSAPAYVSFQVFWPEDADEKLLKAQMQAAAKLCREKAVKVGGSDVSVLSDLKEAAVSATALGQEGSLFEAEPAAADQDLIMAGYCGISGSLKLLKEQQEKLYAHFNPAFFEDYETITDHCVYDAARIAGAAGAKTMAACGEGGIFTGAWEIARQSGLGVHMELKKILLRQETVEICDYLNVSPYRIPSDGTLLLTAVHGQKVLEELAAAGIPAAIIGHMTNDNDRVIVNEEEVRFLEPFRGEEELN